MIQSTNKSLRAVIIVVVLLVGAASLSFAEYDGDHVVRVMRNNVVLMGAIGDAAEAENWFLAAEKLFELAQGMMGILLYDPPRGSKADWTATITEFIDTAFMGIGACGARDAEALGATIGRLWQLNGQGHGAHRG
jgi:hypothetical protein